jgi:hypothetical protein
MNSAPSCRGRSITPAPSGTRTTPSEALPPNRSSGGNP